ncbi:MAG: LPS export ABC transporter permease LptG [Nitrospinota bacterium]|nr:LPS export ABC transporter permease LptG [Nitrospinota bacterium]
MLKVLDRYIMTEFMTIFFGSFVVMVVFYEMVSFIDMAGYFFKHHAPLNVIFRYLFFRIPMAFFHVTPICVLLAATLSMAGMSKFSEIVAMKAAGISLLRIALPMIITAGGISAVAFMDSEYIFHLAAKETTRIYIQEVKKETRKAVFQSSKVWYRADDGSLWNIGALDLVKMSMRDISVYRFDPETNRISSRIVALSAGHNAKGWILKNCVQVLFDKDGGFTEHSISQMEVPDKAIPINDLVKEQLDPEEMNLEEISQYIADTRSKGYDATRYVAEYYGKIAFPLISFIMPFIAVPLGARSSRSGGFLFGIMISVLIGVGFWFTFSMGLSLGRAGRLPPFFSAFAAHFVFMMAGLYMLTTNRQ